LDWQQKQKQQQQEFLILLVPSFSGMECKLNVSAWGGEREATLLPCGAAFLRPFMVCGADQDYFEFYGSLVDTQQQQQQQQHTWRNVLSLLAYQICLTSPHLPHTTRRLD